MSRGRCTPQLDRHRPRAREQRLPDRTRRRPTRPMYGLSAVFTIVDQLPPITLVSNTGQTRNSNEFRSDTVAALHDGQQFRRLHVDER